KTGLVTMDNASNNNTMMEELEEIFTIRGIPFDADGNRIRPAMTTYLHSLETGLIGTCRSVVAACRVSGQRRQELRRIICEGNEKETWDGELPLGKKHLSVLQLLRDCETRWSSTYLMIDHMLYLYPAVRKFLINIDQTDLSHHLFSTQQLNILRDIHQVLELPHMAQELLSAERTPTLSLSLPLYEILIEQWQLLRPAIPELALYIDIGIQKLEDYVGEARKTRIYAHAMVLNPCMKFDWMEKHWGKDETQEAREWIKESVWQLHGTI
ncbi:ribonuclease H-like domain-containing protein, partial [Collybia nuda]